LTGLELPANRAIGFYPVVAAALRVWSSLA
jgi:hypothetical protein